MHYTDFRKHTLLELYWIHFYMQTVTYLYVDCGYNVFWRTMWFLFIFELKLSTINSRILHLIDAYQAIEVGDACDDVQCDVAPLGVATAAERRQSVRRAAEHREHAVGEHGGRVGNRTCNRHLHRQRDTQRDEHVETQV